MHYQSIFSHMPIGKFYTWLKYFTQPAVVMVVTNMRYVRVVKRSWWSVWSGSACHIWYPWPPFFVVENIAHVRSFKQFVFVSVFVFVCVFAIVIVITDIINDVWYVESIAIWRAQIGNDEAMTDRHSDQISTCRLDSSGRRGQVNILLWQLKKSYLGSLSSTDELKLIWSKPGVLGEKDQKLWLNKNF